MIFDWNNADNNGEKKMSCFLYTNQIPCDGFIPLDLSVVNLRNHHSPPLVAGSLFLSWYKY